MTAPSPQYLRYKFICPSQPLLLLLPSHPREQADPKLTDRVEAFVRVLSSPVLRGGNAEPQRDFPPFLFSSTAAWRRRIRFREEPPWAVFGFLVNGRVRIALADPLPLPVGAWVTNPARSSPA